jgi:hypothetical protein
MAFSKTPLESCPRAFSSAEGTTRRWGLRGMSTPCRSVACRNVIIAVSVVLLSAFAHEPGAGRSFGEGPHRETRLPARWLKGIAVPRVERSGTCGRLTRWDPKDRAVLENEECELKDGLMEPCSIESVPSKADPFSGRDASHLRPSLHRLVMPLRC